MGCGGTGGSIRSVAGVSTAGVRGRLRDTAGRAGQWTGIRDWALEYLRGRARVEEFYVRVLISVLICEDSPDEAWDTAVAAPGQVPEQQWWELIGLRELDHPADVIGPMRDLIEAGIERTGDKYRYPKAIKALKQLRDDYRPQTELARGARSTCRQGAERRWRGSPCTV
jgi:hypothetical protein